jgi:hypothetical protein
MISGIPFVAADTDPSRKITEKDKLATKLTRIAAIFAAIQRMRARWPRRWLRQMRC